MAVLDQEPDREQYGEVIGIESIIKDPFLHEARVHLFSRDINVVRGDEAEDEDTRREKYTIAYWENRILEKYFGPLLQASSYDWPAEIKAKVEDNALTDSTYESRVSKYLMTNFSQQQVLWFFIGVLSGLILLGQIFGKRVSG